MPRFIADLYKIMITYYPWRGRISRKDHLSTSIYMTLHEAYLFEERLKRYFEAVAAVAASLQLQSDRAAYSHTLKKYHKRFGKLLRLRGFHVHKNDFEPRELSWIGTLDLLAAASEKAPWKALLPSAIKEARLKWLSVHADVKAATSEFLTIAVRQTKPVWQILKESLEAGINKAPGASGDDIDQ